MSSLIIFAYDVPIFYILHCVLFYRLETPFSTHPSNPLSLMTWFTKYHVTIHSAMSSYVHVNISHSIQSDWLAVMFTEMPPRSVPYRREPTLFIYNYSRSGRSLEWNANICVHYMLACSATSDVNVFANCLCVLWK